MSGPGGSAAAEDADDGSPGESPEPDVPAARRSHPSADFQVEIVVGRSGHDDQVFALNGRWRDRGGGWLESELAGTAGTGADPCGELPVTGFAAIQVQRLLRAPLQLRHIELDLRFGDGHLRVRHSPSLGIQFLGLTVPGTLTTAEPADGAPGESAEVRLNWDQVRNLAMNLVFAPPGRPDRRADPEIS